MAHRYPDDPDDSQISSEAVKRTGWQAKAPAPQRRWPLDTMAGQTQNSQFLNADFR